MDRSELGLSIPGNKEKLIVALDLAEAALVAKDREKEAIAIKLAEAVKDLAVLIEEKEKYAEELAEVNKELESFSYSVSHDLRTPLRAISGFAEVLVEDYGDKFDDEARIYFSEISRNVKKMGDLIDNLLEFSRLSKKDILRLKVNLNEIVKGIVKEHQQLDSMRKVDVVIKDLPGIEGDKNMLNQLFFNLISNAFKYTGKKKEAIIEIGSYAEDEQQVYYVKDNGAGFDSRYYDKLFGVFQRLHSSNEFDGTGVGLAIVHRIASKHDGKVWAEGKVGEGACFYVSFPIKH